MALSEYLSQYDIVQEPPSNMWTLIPKEFCFHSQLTLSPIEDPPPPSPPNSSFSRANFGKACPEKVSIDFPTCSRPLLSSLSTTSSIEPPPPPPTTNSSIPAVFRHQETRGPPGKRLSSCPSRVFVSYLLLVCTAWLFKVVGSLNLNGMKV